MQRAHNVAQSIQSDKAHGGEDKQETSVTTTNGIVSTYIDYAELEYINCIAIEQLCKAMHMKTK
jgi:hypothetical protein